MKNEQAGLDPDEPHTPAWFTFLGMAVFLLGGIFVLLNSSEDEEESGADLGAEQAKDAADEPVTEDE